MRKKFAINLYIPEPCSENWDNMTPNEQGRHCKSCNKTVIDFSLFSDRQLAEFFKKAAGSVCGRLTNYQANRQLAYAEPSKHPLFNKLLVGTALATGLTSSAAAQDSTTPPQTITITPQNKAISTDSGTIVTRDVGTLKEPPLDTEKLLKPDTFPIYIEHITCTMGCVIAETTQEPKIDPEPGEWIKKIMDQLHFGTTELSSKPHSASSPKFRDGGGGL
jgi:hypothetical protein